MKTSINTMPKSINSKKNGQHHTGTVQTRVNSTECSIKFMKEFNGQVVVSAEQFKSNPDCFLGKPGNNLRLKDGREVVLACEIGNMVFSLDRMWKLLFGSTLLLGNIATSDDDSLVDAQTNMHLARAYNEYCIIKEFLYPGHKKEGLKEMRRFDKELYRILKNESAVEQLVIQSRECCEMPDNPKFQFEEESIDMEYLAYLIELGYRYLALGLDDEFDSTEDYVNFAWTVYEGCILVTQLRGMGRKAAIEYAANKLGADSKECVETVFKMLTIDKEA